MHTYKLERLRATDIDFTDDTFVPTHHGPGSDKGYYRFILFANKNYLTVFIITSKRGAGVGGVTKDERLSLIHI